MHSDGGRARLMAILGLLAAAALIVRGVIDLHTGTGWYYLLIAGALVTAVGLRYFKYRE